MRLEGREREQIAEDEVWARLAGGGWVRSGRLREGSGAGCSGAEGSRGAFSSVSVAGSGAWERLIGEVSWSEGSGEVGGSSLSCCVWGGWGVSVNHPMEVSGLVRGLEGGESSASERSR